MAELSALRRPVYAPRGDFNLGGAATGGLSLAATGAALGSVIPGVGTAIGAAVGGVIGLATGGLGGGGGGPEVPDRFEVMQHWAIANGIVPAGPTAKMMMLDLLDRGDPRMLYAAQQQAIYVPNLLKRYSKQLQKWRGGPTAGTSFKDAAQQVNFDTSPVGACKCDDRPRQVLAQLVMALQAAGITG